MALTPRDRVRIALDHAEPDRVPDRRRRQQRHRHEDAAVPRAGEPAGPRARRPVHLRLAGARHGRPDGGGARAPGNRRAPGLRRDPGSHPASGTGTGRRMPRASTTGAAARWRWTRATGIRACTRCARRRPSTRSRPTRGRTWTTRPASRTCGRRRPASAAEDRYAIMATPWLLFPLERAFAMQGMETFLGNLALEPEFAEALLRRIAGLCTQLMGHFLSELGDDVDIIKIGDDLGTEESLLMSPAMYRRILKPIHAEYIAFIRAHTKARVFFHTDGDVTDLVDDFVEIGVDILNPIQTSSGRMADIGGAQAPLRRPPELLRRDRHEARPALRHAGGGPRGGPPGHRDAGAGRRLPARGRPHDHGRGAAGEHPRDGGRGDGVRALPAPGLTVRRRARAAALEPAQDEARLPGRLGDQLQRRHPREDRPEQDPQLQPRERRPQAEVDPGPEREVRVRGAIEDQAVGVRERGPGPGSPTRRGAPAPARGGSRRRAARSPRGPSARTSAPGCRSGAAPRRRSAPGPGRPAAPRARRGGGRASTTRSPRRSPTPRGRRSAGGSRSRSARPRRGGRPPPRPGPAG